MNLFLHIATWLGAVTLVCVALWLQVEAVRCFYLAARDATTCYLNARDAGRSRWWMVCWPAVWLTLIPDQVYARLHGETTCVCRTTKAQESP